MKLRWKILIALGVVAILMAADLTVTLHVQPAREVEAYRTFLRDKGEKLEIGELTPSPVAPEDNSVDTVEAAFRKFGVAYDDCPDAMTMVAPGKALVGWMQPDARGRDFTNSWDAFARVVEPDRPAIELLSQVLDRPKLQFYLDYSNPLPELSPMLSAGEKLGIWTVLNLHKGDSGAAATNVLTLLALVHNNATDGLLVSYLTREAMVSLAIPMTWEWLQSTNLTDAHLAALQNGWRQMDFLSDAQSGILMERAQTAAEIRASRASYEQFTNFFASGAFWAASAGTSRWSEILTNLPAGPRLALADVMWRSSWSYSDELFDLRADQITLDALRTMRTNQSGLYKADFDTMSSRLSALGTNTAEQNLFQALGIPAFEDIFVPKYVTIGTVLKALQSETARRVVITAIALKRFQLKHGKWPGSLGELVPEFLTSVPVDPYDGKPLKYHPNADGTFLLYSVGEDGVDDGGDLTPATPSSSSAGFYWLRGKDWVWPQPATPAEVEYFYEHPPK